MALPARTYAPTLPGAEMYGRPVEDRPGGAEIDILGAVKRAAKSAGVRPARWEGRLARLARDLAGAAPFDGPPPGRLVDYLGWHHGLTEPSPHLVMVEVGSPASGEALQAIEAHVAGVLAETGEHYGRVGVGIVGRRLVIALGESHVEMPALPRSLSRGDRLDVRARIRPPFAKPKGYLQDPGGTTRPLSLDGRSLRVVIACGDSAGRYQVEVTGEDRLGVAVLANFPVWCGMDPPTELSWTPSGAPPKTAEEAEAAIFALVQRDRKSGGLSELRADPRLVALSRAHSRDMLEGRFVGHVSPTAGSPAERARRSGLSARVLLENVARAYSPEDVQAGLLESPGHRENILNPEVTHLGVGVALGQSVGGRRELWVTQTFARFE